MLFPAPAFRSLPPFKSSSPFEDQIKYHALCKTVQCSKVDLTARCCSEFPRHAFPRPGDSSDHGNRLPGDKGSMGFRDELARLPLANLPLNSSFILGKLLTAMSLSLFYF